MQAKHYLYLKINRLFSIHLYKMMLSDELCKRALRSAQVFFLWISIYKS